MRVLRNAYVSKSHSPKGMSFNPGREVMSCGGFSLAISNTFKKPEKQKLHEQDDKINIFKKPSAMLTLCDIAVHKKEVCICCISEKLQGRHLHITVQ
ncbi:hypothetical protein TNCV_3743121 [Trichonephila clavipes]|nr:hypothetical protein TNCV_3743121 [Trichonephila clavipes]